VAEAKVEEAVRVVNEELEVKEFSEKHLERLNTVKHPAPYLTL